MADLRIVDVDTILSKWHDLLKSRWPNFPCQTFTAFMHNHSQELVRCRECKHHRDQLDDRFVICRRWRKIMEEDGFCHKGAKMDGGVNDV